MKTALVYDTRFLDHNDETHPENASRLRSIVSALAESNLLKSVQTLVPREAAEKEISLIHDDDYILTLKKFCARGGGYLDPDTYAYKPSYDVAKLSAGGVLTAVDSVMKKEADVSFALVRPPGHHAESGHAMGFCLFNNAAIAAKYVQKEHGLKKVFIVDWDLHHGNGTQHSFYDDASVLYFSTHQYPYYPGTGNYDETGAGAGEGFTVNVPLPGGCGDNEYVYVFEKILVPLTEQFAPDFILVSCGFDAYEHDPLGGMKITEEGFLKLFRIVQNLSLKLCENRLVLALEGGYHLKGLGSIMTTLVASLVPENAPAPPSPETFVTEKFRDRIKTIQDYLKPRWKFER